MNPSIFWFIIISSILMIIVYKTMQVGPPPKKKKAKRVVKRKPVQAKQKSLDEQIQETFDLQIEKYEQELLKKWKAMQELKRKRRQRQSSSN